MAMASAHPLGVTEVLRQLPQDVVDANVWQRIDNVPAFKLAERAAKALVHATKRSVELRPAKWGAGGEDDEKAVAGALAQYKAVERLAVKLEASYAPCRDAAAAADDRGEQEGRLRALLRRASPFLAMRVKHFVDVQWCSSHNHYFGSGFTALLAECLPSLRSVEGLRLRADAGGVGALAGLPHLTVCDVSYSETSVSAFQQEVQEAGALGQALLRLRLSAAVREDAATEGGSSMMVPSSPPAVDVAPLGALQSLEDLDLAICPGGSAKLQPVAVTLAGLPASLKRLRVTNLPITEASCRALAALPGLCWLAARTVGQVEAGARLPATVQELRLADVRMPGMAALAPALAPLAGTSVHVAVRDYLNDTDGGNGEDDAGGEAEREASALQQAVALRGLACVRSLHLELNLTQPRYLAALLGARVLPALAPALRRLEVVLLGRGWDVAASDGLMQQLDACARLQVLRLVQMALRPAAAQLVLGAQLPQLHHVELQGCRLEGLAPAGGSGGNGAVGNVGLLGACLAARPAEGLAPLHLSTSLLTRDEAAGLQAELRAAGNGHYTVTG